MGRGVSLPSSTNSELPTGWVTVLSSRSTHAKILATIPDLTVTDPTEGVPGPRECGQAVPPSVKIMTALPALSDLEWEQLLARMWVRSEALFSCAGPVESYSHETEGLMMSSVGMPSFEQSPTPEKSRRVIHEVEARTREWVADQCWRV
jgi:hypothetical protein